MPRLRIQLLPGPFAIRPTAAALRRRDRRLLVRVALGWLLFGLLIRLAL